MFVKFTVKVFDMPTVTDHPVMSARKDAILGRSSCNSLNNPFRCSWNVAKSSRSPPGWSSLGTVASLRFAVATTASVEQRASDADASSLMDLGGSAEPAKKSRSP